jgi:hypothetical protein
LREAEAEGRDITFSVILPIAAIIPSAVPTTSAMRSLEPGKTESF